MSKDFHSHWNSVQSLARFPVGFAVWVSTAVGVAAGGCWVLTRESGDVPAVPSLPVPQGARAEAGFQREGPHLPVKQGHNHLLQLTKNKCKCIKVKQKLIDLYTWLYA